MNVSQIIAAFGGTSAMARIFNVGPSAVSNWKRDGRFPARLHYRIVKAAEERGIHVPDDLLGQETEDAA